MMNYTAPQWLSNLSLYGKGVPITVVGLGGTGSEVASRLFKMHSLLKKLGGEGLDVTLIDDDIVSPANVGRQGYYDFDVNSSKCQVLATRFNNFSDTQWKYVQARVTKANAAHLIPRTGILLTCVDNPMTRLELGEVLSKQSDSLIWIDGGNDANTAQVVMGTYEHRTDLPYQRLPTVVDLYGEQLRTQEFKDTDSCSHEDAIAKQDFGINDTVAQVMVQLVWQMVRYGETNAHGAIVDMLNFKQSPLPINPDIWAMFSFEGVSHKKGTTSNSTKG